MNPFIPEALQGSVPLTVSMHSAIITLPRLSLGTLVAVSSAPNEGQPYVAAGRGELSEV
jgi:hypothetical protein